MRAIIAHENLAFADALRQAVLAMGLQCTAADSVSHPELPVRLSQVAADVVLVVLDPNPDAALASIQYAARSNTPVLAVGPTSDTQRVLRVMRAGAWEYVDQARLRDDLLVALEKLQHGGTVAFRRGRSIAVLAAAPGSGVTTVASSLAFALAAKYPNQVALAEVGSGVPELALSLNLEPRYSIADLLAQWERMDASMVRQTLVQHAAGVQVLAYKPETLQAEPLTVPAMRQTVVLLNTMFDHCVLDLGHAADAARLEALRLAQTIVLVARLDVPCLRLTRHLIRHLDEQGVPRDRLRLVVNRHGQRQQVAREEAAKVLGLPILEGIPDDPTSVNQSRNQGQPLIAMAKRAAITRSFAELANRLHGKAA